MTKRKERELARSTAHLEDGQVDIPSTFAAIRELPVASQALVEERFEAAVREFKKTGDHVPLLEYAAAITATARLHRDPKYRKALAETQGETFKEGREISEVIADLQRRYAPRS